MTQQMHDTPDSANASVQDEADRLTALDYLVMALCAIGVVVSLAIVLEYSGIALFNEHTREVVAEWWDRYMTIGVVIVTGVMVAIGLFVWLLARWTIGSDADEYRVDDLTDAA